jgi:hypothetical protein
MLAAAREQTTSQRRDRTQEEWALANLDTIIVALRRAKYAARRGLACTTDEAKTSDYAELLFKIRDAKHFAQDLHN